MKRESPSSPRAAEASGKHYYQFYKGRDDLFRMVIPFLLRGLENDEACLWVVSRSVGVLEAIEAFQKTCNPNSYLESGQLVILAAERWYLEGGRFSVRKVLERMKKFVVDKERMGFTAFRGVGDLGWLKAAEHDWAEFQSYEEKAHQWIHKLPMVAICAYPLNHCSITQTKDILDCHDHVFLYHPLA